MGVFFCQLKKSLYLCIRKSRGGAVVARWAHNPEVVGSNPAPATKIWHAQQCSLQGRQF